MDSDGERLSRGGNLNIAGIERLVRMLERFKHYGFQNPSSDDVWDDIQPQTGNRSNLPHDELCRLRQSLEESKQCMAVLNEARSYLDGRIQLIQTKLIPLVLEDAVKTLPNELLSHIFEAGHRMTEDCAFAKTVSSVSHRFRQVALRTPLLWTRISALYSDDQVEAFLSRSRESGLIISTRCRPSQSRLQSFLHILGPASNRVLHLKLGYGTTADIMQKSALTSFPGLRLLDVGRDIDFSSWQLPSLSEFHGMNLSKTLRFQAQLVIVDLLFDGYADLASLSQALNSMTSLRDLSLTLSTCTAGHSEPIKHNRGHHSVPIETLRIAIEDHTPQAVTALLYDALHILSPITVEITLSNLDNDHPPRFLYNSVGQIFPYGSTIKICISALGTLRHGWDEFALLPTLVKGCNIAHTVHINAPMASILDPEVSDDEDWNIFASLRHLQLKYCDELMEWEINRLVDNLVIGNESGRNLQSLEILSCRDISEDFLLELSGKVGPKLTWKP